MAADRPPVTGGASHAEWSGDDDSQSLRFRALIEHSADFIVLLDRAGVAFYQSPSTRALGHEPHYLIGLPLIEPIHHEDRAHVLAAFGRVVETADGRAVVALRLAHADGYWVAVEAIMSNMLEDPFVRAVVVNAREVTERIVAEEALQRSQQELLKSQAQLLHSQKMEAVGRLAGGVAHDFNNLLAAILSNAGMMLETLPHDSPVRGDVEEIREVAQRGAALTRQLLTFSRRQPVAPSVIDLNESTRGLLRMLRRLIGSGLELKTALEPELRMVRVDAGQIEQVLMNLVVNARDAMPHGGTITIETRNPPGQGVSLIVRDTGTGMDAETVSRIFEPFFTTKEAGKGTGLGLATVYGIVAQSGGSVRVDSTVGVGTAFEILLPSVEGEAAAGSPSTRDTDTSGSTILLVDDEAPMRTVLRRLLTGRGYAVLTAGDGEEAIHIAEHHAGHIDVLLTDLNMPGINGHEVARRLSETRPGIRIVIMSGVADVRGEADQGRVVFLEKPFENATLLQVLLDSLQRNDP